MSIKLTAWRHNNMDDNIAIKVQGVSKTFKDQAGATTIKNSFIELGRKIAGKPERHKKKGFTALKDINFEVKKGEFFGIVGRNGSGKSTLLKILAGVYTPTTGGVAINGSLTPFIELGVGFNPELTGKDNVYLNSALLGFSRKQTDAMYNKIVDFAELHDFMDTKLKNYSSGMQVRLAFSVAIRAESDILLLDEVLAVGDSLFQKKCYDYFKQLKKNKKSVVFVSHDSNALLEYCDNGILLEKTGIVYNGGINNVVSKYTDILNKHEENKHKLVDYNEEVKRWGTGAAKITKIITHGKDSKVQKKVYTDDDKHISIRVDYKANIYISQPIFGISIFDASGQRVFASNTMWSKIKTKDMEPGTPRVVTWIVPNAFNTGSFSISPAIADSTGVTTYDWWDSATSFKIRKELKSIAYINIKHEVIVQ